MVSDGQVDRQAASYQPPARAWRVGLAEQHDERTEMRRDIGLDVLIKFRLTLAGRTSPRRYR
jgi:hypothetical protein